MRQMERVLWTRGVLLTPQHLQLQDRFVEDTVGFKIRSMMFSPWGFSRLEIDFEALGSGSLTLSLASGLMPDGMPFDAPASDASPAPKPLEDFWNPDRGHLDLFLAIPERRIGGRNVSASAAETGTRFSAEVVLRRDENTGLMEKPIQVARKNFRLLADGEALEGWTALPVARVVRSPSGEFQLDPAFVPPLLDISASDLVMSITRRLVELLSAKSMSLAAARRQRSKGLAEFGVSDVENFWLLYTVNGHLPYFRHLLETRRGHPAALFEAMLGLAGALTTFSRSVQPTDLPAYDHATPGDCFVRLDQAVRELLGAAVPLGHATLPLEEISPSVFATPIEENRYLSAPAVYLAVKADVGGDQLEKDAPRLFKISSGSQVERLVRQALPGVGLRRVASAPSALPQKIDHAYFEVERAGEHWEAIARERNLAVFVPSEFGSARLELVVLLPRE